MIRPGARFLSTLLIGACAHDHAERHELDGITVVEALDEPICGGTLSSIERRLGALEHETGLPRDPRGLVFHWIYERAVLPEHCGAGVGGCAHGRSFYGPLWSFSHELAHAHLSRLGRPRVWLVEGMATMLETDFSGKPDPTVTPSDMLPIEDPRGLDYTAAGAFTAYLRDRYGMPLLLDYYAATAGSDPDSSVATFRDIFGDAFPAVEADYLASDMPAAVGSPDCDVAEVAWRGDTWTHPFTLSCDDPRAVGPEEALDEPERSLLGSGVTMTAPAGHFAFTLEGTGESWITIVRCDHPELVFVWTDEPHAEADLEGGRYRVYADAFIDTHSSATVTIRRLPESSTGVTSPRTDAAPPASPRRRSGPSHE